MKEDAYKGKEYKNPNVICFLLILSPLVFSVISSIVTACLAGSSITSLGTELVASLAATSTASTIYFFCILCAAFMVLFGKKNKFLYPMGVTLALTISVAVLLEVGLRRFVSKTGAFYVMGIVVCMIIVIVSVTMFVSIVKALHGDASARRLAQVSTLVFMVLIVFSAIGSIFTVNVTGERNPLIYSILYTLRIFMYINIPFAVYVLVQQALATNLLSDGNLKLENK